MVADIRIWFAKFLQTFAILQHCKCCILIRKILQYFITCPISVVDGAPACHTAGSGSNLGAAKRAILLKQSIFFWAKVEYFNHYFLTSLKWLSDHKRSLACDFSLVWDFWLCSRQYFRLLSCSRFIILDFINLSCLIWDSFRLIHTYSDSIRLIQTQSDSIRLIQTHWTSLSLMEMH